MSATHIHTIPVDISLTTEEAWREICLMGLRTTYSGYETWANLECDGDECRNILKSENYTRAHNDIIIEKWENGIRVI